MIGRSKIAIVGIIWVILCGQGVFAQVDSSTWIVPRAPAYYIVQKGDTLWDIACKFLHDPWRWKQIWISNPDIENPDLIYPGDELSLSFIAGKPQLMVMRRHGVHARIVNNVVILSPTIRSFPADSPIPTIPLSVIGPFFNSARVITPEQGKYCPPIIALDEDHLVVGIRDRIYVSDLSRYGNDTVFSVFRPGKEYISPFTDELLGVEGIILGKAQLELLGEPSRLVITENFEEIKVGDHLITTNKERVDPFFIPKYPQNNAYGQIISVFGGINQIGQYQVIVITGGLDKQREIGDVLSIFQVQKDIPPRLLQKGERSEDFPPLHEGVCMVFRVFDRVSYALVMKATRAIYLHDEVTNP